MIVYDDDPRDRPVEDRTTEDWAKLEKTLDEVMEERDNVIDWADRLAYAIAPQSVIGEHTSANDPWQNALDHLDVEPTYEYGVRCGCGVELRPPGLVDEATARRLAHIPCDADHARSLTRRLVGPVEVVPSAAPALDEDGA